MYELTEENNFIMEVQRKKDLYEIKSMTDEEFEEMMANYEPLEIFDRY